MLATVTGLITTVFVSIVGLIAYKRLKPAIKREMKNEANLIEARFTQRLGKMVEDVDIGELVGKVTGGGGSAGGLGDLLGASGGIGDLLKLLQTAGGTERKGKEKMGL